MFQELFQDPLKELNTFLPEIETDHSGDTFRIVGPDSDVDRKAIETALSAIMRALWLAK